MIREINIIAKGEEGPMDLTVIYFSRCKKEKLLPIGISFGAILVEHKGKKIARVILKGLAEDGIRERSIFPMDLEKIFEEAKVEGKYMITATILKKDGQMDHHFVMKNFPPAEMLNANFEHERLVRKEKAALSKE